MRRSNDGGTPAVRIEAENEWAWCGDRRLDLTPRAFAVLRHLVEHPARLVTKDDLLSAIWGDTVVSESALASCIRDVRRALADSSSTPRYIETVHRRGFRFIGPVGPAIAAKPSTTIAPATIRDGGSALVGRGDDLARLESALATALAGRRQVVFVTGEAGIGKTTLVETFLARLDGGESLRIGRGQCVEQYGAGEAYLPVLEALGRMGRERPDALVRILTQYAPTWLAQLPALLSDTDLEGLRRRTQGTTRDRMLRELIEALDAASAETPLVLVLEDLHWSDSATIDLLSMLARRRDAARLLVVGTYRPADVAASSHPLKSAKQELQLHGHCDEIALEFLSESAVAEYLARRLPNASIPARLLRTLHRSTSGNPLFLVNVVDHLIDQGRVREVDGQWALTVPVDDVTADVPDTLWQMVEHQVERLSPLEQTVLAVASVAGAEFSAAIVGVDGIDPHEAEQCCANLARRGQFLRTLDAAAWPDGTIAGRYAFVHALYQNVLYARVSIGRRVGLHLRIGARLEQAFGARADEIAGELAMHFEEGRDFERAVRYRRQAADHALGRHAYRETAQHATRALELVAALPESDERLARELALLTVLGAALIARGWTAPEVVQTYARARELSSRAGATPQLFPVLGGLFGFYMTRVELGPARDLAQQLAALAAAIPDPGIRLGAHNAAGMVAFHAGDWAAALAEFEKGIAVYDPELHSPNRSPAFWGGHDTGVSCMTHAAWCSWALGRPTRAAEQMRQALELARSVDHPLTIAFASHFAASLYECRRDPDAVRDLAEAAIAYSTEHGFELLSSLAAVHRGWLLVQDGHVADGAAQIRFGLAHYREQGSGFGVPTYLTYLAEAYEKLERPDDGLAVVADALALAKENGAHYWDAELHRLRGALLLQRGSRPGSSAAAREAEASFREAIAIARRQQAKTLELRATTSLCALLQAQGKRREAHAMLSEVFGAFDEGFETTDLAQAKALLDVLGRSGDGARRS